MSNPTTPFSWQMPTATDLVTDLPADFEVFGQAVATSMSDLLGGTTGQILSKATNTDMDFTWVSPNPGDITGITATSPLTGGGTSGDVTVGIQASSTTQSGAVQLTDSTSSTSTTTAATPNSVKTSYDLANAAIPKSLVDAKGDILTATADNTPARLAVGTNGQTLVANSSTASGLEWQTPASGGWTSIASGTLSGASVSLTSIPSTYKNLTIYLNNPYASTTADFRVTINSDTSASYNYWSWNPSFTTSSGGSDNFVRLGAAGSLITANNNYGSGFIEFPNYYSTTAIKVGRVMYQGSSGACYGGYWNCIQSYVPAAISSIQLKTSTGTFSGGTYELWGQK